MTFTAAPRPGGPEPVLLLVRRDLPRSRLTVFFRLLLVIPHAFVLIFLTLAAFVVVVIGWFGALVLGRLPLWAYEYLTGWLGWSTRMSAYLYLVTDDYPPFAFAAPDYPVQLLIPPPGPLNRWAVFFRAILAIPAYVVTVCFNGIWLFVVFAWFAGVFAGRTPRAVFDAVATAVRYQTRMNAYLWLMTPTYPWGAFGDRVDRSVAAPPGWSPSAYPPGYPAAYPPGYPTAPGPAPAPEPAPLPAEQPGPVALPMPPGYPPMPPPRESAPPDDGSMREPAWYTGVLTSGGQAIVIIALVLGLAQYAGNVATGGFGRGIGGLGHLGATIRVENARTDVRDAAGTLAGGGCNQSADSFCALQRAQDLDASLTELRGRVVSAPAEGGRRAEVLSDIDSLRAAVATSLDNGSLLAGGTLDPQVSGDISRLETALDDYVDALVR